MLENPCKEKFFNFLFINRKYTAKAAEGDAPADM